MSGTRGIVAAAGYVPYRRLQRAEIAAFFGSGGGRGTRSVASYDEDTTSMGVEAARLALRGTDVVPETLLFATADPAYLEKTNATTVHAALRLGADVAAFDAGGAVRSGIGALSFALRADHPVLVVSSDFRGGLPTSADEGGSGDAAAALVVGDGPGVVAEHIGGASRTREFIDRWRTPGDPRPRQWEERFGEVQYTALTDEAWNEALKRADLEAENVDVTILTGTHTRAVKSIAGKLKAPRMADDRTSVIGQTGTAHAALLLADTLEQAEPGQVIALVHLCDGVDVLLFRVTDAIKSWRPARTVAAQLEHTADLPYGKFLSWRDVVHLEPPRRPEPGRISASISARTRDYKYAFVGSQDAGSGDAHLPPQRITRNGDALDEMSPLPMSDVEGTISTFTIDRIAYSPSPPIAFAVVDFDNGARLPVELCDLDASKLAMGDRVEMTFRRLYTADGIHNYFWKARPLRG
ncbi:MAG TPA: OB-fold domain-containing protein [Acidimicrobiia bacterium]|jgi:3-hydroxy-3-methylglutaryl CoA synthase